MTITPFLFWLMVGFGSFGAVTFLLAVFFHENKVAGEMIEIIEKKSDDILEFLDDAIRFIIASIILVPSYFYANYILTKKVKLTILSKNNDLSDLMKKKIVKTLTDDEIIEYQVSLDGDEIYSKIGRDNFELMDRINTNKAYWQRVSRNPSKEVIERFADRLFWDIVFRTTKLEKEFIEEYVDFVDWKVLVNTQTITEEFFFDFYHKIDVKYINVQKNRWFKKGRRSNKLEAFLKLQGIDI